MCILIFMNKDVCEDSFSRGIRDGIPICLGYLSVSFAFGIFAVNQGLFPWQALLISMTNVTSAGQLAGVPIITGMLPFVEMALSQLIINLRYALMSISLSQKMGDNVRLLDRFIIAFCNTDEIFAVASGREGTVGRHYMRGLALTPYLGWSSGTILGAVAGNLLPSVVSNALGIAIYGMFIAIVVPVAKRNRAVLACVFVSCGLSVLFAFAPVLNQVSGGFVIIICAVVSSAIFAVLRPVESDSSDSNSKEEK